MKKNILLIGVISIVILSGVEVSFSQKGDGGNVFKKGTDEYKMFMAKQDFFGGDYRSALNKFKEVEKNRPNDGNIHFWIGNCYYMMKTYQDAVDELEKAKSLDPNASSELSLALGKAYHARGMIDKALEELNAYRKTVADSPKKISESEVDVEIAQCNVAKEMMAHPVNAKLSFLIDLNSQYDDKGPVLTGGDKVMIFTSRRPEGDKSKTDKEGDYGYFDNVYESFWSDEKKTWLAGDLIRGPINLDGGYNSVTSISSDGNQMFIYRNHVTEAHGGEIFVSKKATSGKWKTPEILLKPVNTSYYEDAAVLSPDGNTLYFVSERPGGLGQGDIWLSKKMPEGWAEPVNMGAPVNSPFDENGLWLAPDGKTLFFCSNGPNSIGSYDIFKTTMDEKGKWSNPVNIGYPINSVGIESKFVMTADKKTAYIATVRDSGLGERDIIMVDISNYDVMSGVSKPLLQTASLAGKITGADSTHKALPAEIRILDKATGMQSAMTKSGEDGSYIIDFPCSKPCLIEVSSEGYQKFSEEISLPAGKTETKNITLSKSQ
ncbi:MAG: PD40 domain-containing protein [Bacteroidetes bacterium]|nr:PD40 domain-containing protein [Bacteroidota bacterium]